MLTADRLRSLLIYDPERGTFTRRDRPDSTFANKDQAKAWRRHWLGAPAGSLTDRGYVTIRVDGASYRAHRLAWLYMTGSWPLHEIDHRDGDRSNNSFENLRDIPGAGNRQNTKRQANNTSGFTGVVWAKNVERWHAKIKINRRTISLGYFETRDAAYRAYLAGKAKHHQYQPVPRELEFRA